MCGWCEILYKLCAFVCGCVCVWVVWVCVGVRFYINCVHLCVGVCGGVCGCVWCVGVCVRFYINCVHLCVGVCGGCV